MSSRQQTPRGNRHLISHRDTWLEAARNLRARFFLTATCILVVIGAVFGASVATSSEVRSLHRDWDSLRQAGAYAWQVRSDSPSGIPSEQCESLNAVTGVLHAGSVLSSSKVSIAQGGQQLTFLRVSPGFVGMAWPDIATSPRTGFVSEQLGQTLGFVDGASLEYVDDQGSPRFLDDVGRITTTSKLAGVNNALVVVDAVNGRSSDCFVEATAGTHEAVRSVLAMWFPDDLKTLAVDLVPKERDGQRDVDQILQTRVTVWMGPAIGLLCVLVPLLLWWMQRGEFALYRLSGLPIRRLIFMLYSEWVILVLIPIHAGLLAALIAQQFESFIQLEAVTQAYAQVVLLSFLAPLLGGGLLGRQHTVDTLKGR